MPPPVPLPIRQRLVQLAHQGRSAKELAERFGLPERTVRHLLRRFRQQPDSLAPRYAAGPGRPPGEHPARPFVLALRQQHPQWGAGFLRLQLQRTQPELAVPSERTLQRWLRQQEASPPAAGCRPAATRNQAALPHQVWQIDAAEQMQLASGDGASWLRLVDEASGAFLHTAVFPQRFWSQVEEPAVQHQLRVAFTRWGLPLRVRVDNGKPGGSTGDWPPVLAMWLIGLGLEVLWNPPRQPQKNGVVERSQGTAKRWGEPTQCVSVAELQRRLDEADALQREAYPYVQQRSRSQVWPQLQHSGRPYRREEEAGHWRLERVLNHLSGYAVVRRVDVSGKVSLYDRLRYVGVVHAGRHVTVQFDPERREWLFADEGGRQLRSQPAEEIEADRIRALWPDSRRQR